MTASGPIRAERHDDGDWVARFQAGDSAAFDQIVEAHQGRIARLVFRLLGKPDDVQDVVQEVFLAVFENLERFRGESKLSTWLTTIALNKCRSHQRRRLLRLRTFFYLAKTLTVTSEQGGATESNEIHEELRRAVRRLSARYREPIVLRYFEELPVPEISKVLRISVNSVEVRLTRARHKLREMLSARRPGEK